MTGGHLGGGLGQAIGRAEAGRVEAAVGERGGEALQGAGSNRLGGVAGHLPAPQIQSGTLLGRRAPDAQVVGEVGSPTGEGPEPRNGLQPAHGTGQEGQGPHQDAGAPRQDCVQRVSNQPHVVEEGKPRDDGAFLRDLPGFVEHSQVAEQVAVGDSAAAWTGGRAGGVLKVGQIVWRGEGQAGRVARQAVLQGQTGQVQAVPETRGQALRRQGQGRSGILDQGPQPLQPAGEARRRSRDGHHTGLEAAEEGHQEVQPVLGEEQEGRTASHPAGLQVTCQDPGTAVQLAPGQPDALDLAVCQPLEGQPVGRVGGSARQHLHQGRRGHVVQ